MITSKHTPRPRYLLVATVLTLAACGLSCGSASAALHGIAMSQLGTKVNASSSANFCTLLSGDVCQAGEQSVIAGGFGEFSPDAVAVAPSGNVYVADTGNHRVQEFKPNGEFVLMFGKDVNEKTGGNICTQAEVEAGVKCQVGASGEEAGALRNYPKTRGTAGLCSP